MEKTYQPNLYEHKIYQLWEKANAFTPQLPKKKLKKPLKKKPFCIILPPPNANADLHLGHAMYVIEDILIRYHRLKGDYTLWLPGADHAGIETQFVYEKELQKQGKSRFDFSREELYQQIWSFVQKNKLKMENQLRAMGFSLDWTRKKFTLDPEIVKIVYQTFKKLYDDGLVYRGEKLVNYCTTCGTSFSDLEIEHQEVQGSLWFIKYPLKNSTNFITVATTRPETLLGDTAVAVNPQDKRYQHLKGKVIVLPITNREIPLIMDGSVKKDFGSGAVKVTPAHDENDWQIAEKHHLSKIQIIDFTGRIQQSPLKDIPQELIGLTVKQAREKILKRLQTTGSLLKTQPHSLVLARCYKCHQVIEPLPLPQWFIKVAPLTKKAIEVVKNGDLKIIPKRFERIYFQWLESLRDWNISRQVIWGIRIPAWRCLKCAANQKTRWLITSGEKPDKCPDCHGSAFQQDPDTFDTWFSSAQWPFVTLKTSQPSDFDFFYPTSVMDTMWDILPFWVIRMVMLGLYLTGKIPFRVVYLHSRVVDEKGQKMSKSKGNVINPANMVAKYGADALRLSLVFGTAPGKDLCLSEAKIRGFRNFTNKLWNIARFIKIVSFEEPRFYPKLQNLKKLKAEDKEILKALKLLVENTTAQLENFHFASAAEALYQFIWHRFADQYLEKIKERLKNRDEVSLKVLHHTFLTCLQLLHPFAPFITEVLWQKLKPKSEPLLITSAWPKNRLC